MHSKKTLQIAALAVLFAPIYAGSVIKGHAKQTTRGMTFPRKPVLRWTQLLSVPVCVLVIAYPLWQHDRLPVWLPMPLVAMLLYILVQMPGTIVLTPTAIEQRFWLRPSKRIEYGEVIAVYRLSGGRVTRVLGDNRASIAHSGNHVAADEFRQEILQRTGKRVTV